MHFSNNPIQIGRPDKLVEIDESMFGKRKYNRGRRRNGKWVFGGCERGSKLAFMVEVAQRDAATLLPLCQKYILPGTAVLSDEWRAYCQLQQDGFVHDTVNHSLNFVDPSTGVHTQNVECMWSKAKKKQKEGNGTSEPLLHSYLPEYLWRRKYGDRPFQNIIEHIAEVYQV